MARFQNTTTKVVVSVDDSKAHRFTDGWQALDGDPDDTPAVLPQGFDPGDYNVADVVKAIEVAAAAGNGQEVARIVEAETSGKSRAGILKAAE